MKQDTDTTTWLFLREALEHRTPDITPSNENNRQTYPNRELKGSQKLRNLQYINFDLHIYKIL